MALLEIKKLGCETLKQTCAPVDENDASIGELVENMFETMYAAEGIGLAAPQVGVSKRVVVLDVGPHDPGFEPCAMVNPEIVWSAGEAVGEEGCLSMPGISGEVKRAAQIRVRAADVNGEVFERELTGMSARAVQHELDHLDGVLVTELFSTIRRNLIRNQLRRIRREGTKQDPGLVVLDAREMDRQT